MLAASPTARFRAAASFFILDETTPRRIQRLAAASVLLASALTAGCGRESAGPAIPKAAVTPDTPATSPLPNHLYLNQGKRLFDEAGVRCGVAYDADDKPGGSMGIDVGDYDGSGRLSLFVTNYENEMHCVYRNLGKGDFRCVSRQAGITAIGLGYVGFGAGFIDADGDGWPFSVSLGREPACPGIFGRHRAAAARKFSAIKRSTSKNTR